MKLSTEQLAAKKAIFDWMKSSSTQPFLLTGLAGTGKSTLLAEIPTSSFQFCAPTGKAADTLVSKGIKNAKTIHRTIYRVAKGGRFTLDASLIHKPFLAIDEASMISSTVWRDLLSLNIPILLVGDPGQLPPVGEPFGILASKPDAHLVEIHRTALNSPILSLAYHYRKTHMASTRASFETYEGSSCFVSTHGAVLQKAQDELSLSDTMFLVGKNTDRIKLASVIRDWNGFTDPGIQEEDLLVCRRNNYDHGIFNGQLFRVFKIKKPISEYYMRVDLQAVSTDEILYDVPIHLPSFNMVKKPDYKMHVPGLFDFGYALTVHYSQGSEFPNVVVLEPRGLSYFVDRTALWRYTAATRAQTHLYYGSPYIKD